MKVGDLVRCGNRTGTIIRIAVLSSQRAALSAEVLWSGSGLGSEWTKNLEVISESR